MARAAVESSYTFAVVATDMANNEANATVEISVTDLNDNIPIFPECGNYRGEVSEDATIDTDVITVSVDHIVC